MKREELISALEGDLALIGRRVFSSFAAASEKGRLPTRAQIGIMFALSEGSASTVKEVAEKLCLSSSAVTQVIDALVEAKLLARKEDKEDRRKTCLALTASGKKKIAQIKKLRLASITRLLASLDDKELQTLHRLQRKIIENLN